MYPGVNGSRLWPINSGMRPIPDGSGKLELGGRFELGARVGEMDVLCGTADCRPPPKKLVLDVKFVPVCIPLYPGVVKLDDDVKLGDDWNVCCATGAAAPLVGAFAS